MAIWQFTVILIPEGALKKVFGTVPPGIPIEVAEDFDWWSDVQPPAGFEREIDSILPQIESWSKEIRMWGREDSDTAYVCYADECKIGVEQVSFSVDARAISTEVVDSFCALATRLGCILMTTEYEVLRPDPGAVLSAIGQSTAKKFVDDPVSTLQNLDQTKLQDRLNYLDKRERDPGRE